MAKEKQPEPEVMIEPQPQLSERTLAEMEAGRKMAAINAQTLAAAEKARAEVEAKK